MPYLPYKYDEEQLEELLEKERNILYVAMTRARQALIFLYSGKKSRFLNEMNSEYMKEK